MSSEFGYIPESPEQSFGNNKGIFTPKDIYDLTRADKYTNYGQLELIETQTVSGTPTTIDFTSIDENIYNVHFMTYNNIHGNSTTAQDMGARVSNDGGSTFESSNYQWANQNYSASGSFTENKSTSGNRFMIAPDLDNETNASLNGYIYFYNLGDSTKYSFVTDWNFIFQSAVGGRGRGGSSVYTVAETINAIQLMSSSAGGFSEGVVSLYGIKEYS
jgi:hypothetical protein